MILICRNIAVAALCTLGVVGGSMGVAQADDPALAGAAPSGAAPVGQMSQGDAMKAVHLAAANQLGVLEFCQSKGDIGADAVDLQRKMIGMLPPPAEAGEGVAEETGKKGIVSVGTQTVSLDDAAKAHQTTPSALCKQMETMLKQNAAQMGQMQKQ